MKPLHLNLAARPYRDYRPVYAVVVVTSLLIAFLAFNNFDTWLRYRNETRSTREEIARIEGQIAQERQRTEIANRQIGRMDLLGLSKETKYINIQLAQRAFPWSELLDDLERVLPESVRITSVAPVIDEGGIVHLSLACEGKSGESMLATLRALQDDARFANPFPTGEENTGAFFRFGVTVDYRPTSAKVVKR